MQVIIVLKLDHGKIQASLAEHKLKEKLELKALLMKRVDSPPREIALSMSVRFIQSIDKVYTVAAKAISSVTLTATTIYRLWKSPPVLTRRGKPILQMSFLRFLSTFLSMDKRQPWLVGNLQLAGYPLYLQPPGSLVDKYVPAVHLLNTNYLILH